MGNELALYEPIRPPIVDRPGTIPSWPEWLNSLIGGCERTMSGKLEIRASQALTQTHRDLISTYVRNLDALCEKTPENDRASDQAMLIIISKMLKVLAGSKKQESDSEMKAEAYAVALEDIPCWAIDAAVRGWYRGAYGGKHDYAWPPAPATLRALSLSEAGRIRGRAIVLRNLLAADVVPDYTQEQRFSTLRKLADVLSGISGRAAMLDPRRSEAE